MPGPDRPEAAEQRLRVEWIVGALLPMSVGSKILLFWVGQFHVQWAMTAFDRVSLFFQEAVVWALVFLVFSLLAARRPRRWLVPLAVVVVNLVLLLQLVDMRCKQLFYQPLAWATATEAMREAGIVKSSLGLFFGPSFTPFLIISMTLLDLPLLALRIWRRRGQPRRPFGKHGVAFAAAVAIAGGTLVLTVAREQAYRLDDDVVSGWLVHSLRALRSDDSHRALREKCDEPARALGPELLRYPAASAPARGKNIVLFIGESLAYTASSLGDPASDRTPWLRELASTAAIATTCRTQVSVSTKAIYGILSGRYANPELEMLESMVTDLEGLPRVLARHGYATAFVSSQFLGWQNTGRQYRAMGFDRILGAEKLIERGKKLGHPPAPSSSWGIDDRALADAVKELIPDDRPSFLVVYNVASHHPYTYPGHSSSDSNYQRYLKAVRYGDAAMRAVAEEIQRHARGRDSLVVVVGDHGENIREDFYAVRGCLLAETEHNVPLVFSVPGGSRLPSPVGARQIDIAPTILDFAGITPDIPMQGRSLAGREPAGAAYINSYGRCQLIGVVDGQTKQIYDRGTRRAWSFDLAADPLEKDPRPLAAEQTGALARRLDACAAYDELALRDLLPR